MRRPLQTRQYNSGFQQFSLDLLVALLIAFLENRLGITSIDYYACHLS